MQGKKKKPPKLFYNFSLEEYIPENNFYRILKDHLDLSFIYKKTKKYYGHTGRPSLDPVVFFKYLIIGFLENICSDRALERMVQMRLDLAPAGLQPARSHLIINVQNHFSVVSSLTSFNPAAFNYLQKSSSLSKCSCKFATCQPALLHKASTVCTKRLGLLPASAKFKQVALNFTN
jgi:hypothetical protein